MKPSIKINVVLYNHKGEKKTASIVGFGHIETGILVGRISTTKGKWSKGEKIFPVVCMFTGCPLVAFLDIGVKNPWTSTRGFYEGRQKISSSQFIANTRITTIGLNNGNIKMELEIKLDGKLPELQDIEKPFIEIIEKEKNDLLRGKFNINFNSLQGSIPCKV
ncbi:MAG: hypothetical protein IPL31_05890 [Saprospiraceae bacterium]|nr:hypothetical protein [Saprospiraceae bacterium]